MVRIHVGVDAVAKVSNPPLASKFITKLFGRRLDIRSGAVKSAGVEVALQSDAVPDDLPRFGGIHRPVDADHVVVGGLEILQGVVATFRENGLLERN